MHAREFPSISEIRPAFKAILTIRLRVHGRGGNSVAASRNDWESWKEKFPYEKATTKRLIGWK